MLKPVLERQDIQTNDGNELNAVEIDTLYTLCQVSPSFKPLILKQNNRATVITFKQ